MSLLAGAAVTVVAAAGAVLGAGRRDEHGRLAALVTLGAGVLGAVDDLASARPAAAGVKGLHGHLGALRRGRVTSGSVKLLGLAALAGAASRRIAPRAPASYRTAADRIAAAGVIAGTANLINLLDLRPGRAAKAVLLLGMPLLRGEYGGLAAGAVGAAAGVLPADLAERVMIGDTGAAALGAQLGVRLALGAPPAGRIALLAGLTALTVASERVSFSRIIAATPVLRVLDAAGRAPDQVERDPATAGREPAAAGHNPDTAGRDPGASKRRPVQRT